MDGATIAGLLADPARLKVVAALALGAGTLEEVAVAGGLPLQDVARAVRRLTTAGLVRRDGRSLELLAEHFGGAARAAAQAAPVAAPLSPDPRRTPSSRRSSATAGCCRSRCSNANGGSSWPTWRG